MKKILLMALCVSMMACGNQNNKAENQGNENQSSMQTNVDDDTTLPDPTSILYLGTYKEVNVDGYDAQLRMLAWEDELQLKLESFFEERMHVKCKIDSHKAQFVDSTGIKLTTRLHVFEDNKEVAIDDAMLTFTKIDGNLYKLHVDFFNEPSETSVRNLMADYTMFLTDPNVEHMVHTLPFNINKNNIRLTTLLPELNKYVFMPELWTTVNYIKNGQDRGNLGDTEMITIDERNRFFSYSWGDFNTNLEGKYFHTDDNKILLVTDQHDSTYEHDQNLQFFIIDSEKGTITEEEAYNMLPKEFIDRNSIFQVRYATEGVVAVFDDGEGGLDAKTLKFNGKTFE